MELNNKKPDSKCKCNSDKDHKFSELLTDIFCGYKLFYIGHSYNYELVWNYFGDNRVPLTPKYYTAYYGS